jgi:hypothetical protein
MIARAGAIGSYRVCFAALGMGAEIHDMAAVDKAAIGATCRGTGRAASSRHACHRQDLRDGRHLPRPVSEQG